MHDETPSDFTLPLRVINLWAGPGAGKSTTAAGLFNIMKNLGHRVELVTEVAKDLTYQSDQVALGNQLFILAQQDARLRRLVGKVDWVVTDSPLPLSLVYSTPEYTEWLPEAVWGAYERYRNYDFLVRRVKPYAPYGRNQTEHEALAVDVQVTAIFREATSQEVDGGPPMDAWEITGDEAAPYEIADRLGLLSRRYLETAACTPTRT